MSQFIDGKRCESLHGRASVVRDPSNGDTIAEITLAEPDDVDRAVQAARAAFPDWANAAPVDRSTVLTTFARLLQERTEEFAQLESRQAGKPIRLATRIRRRRHDRQRRLLRRRRPAPRRARRRPSTPPDHTSSIRREPVGVIGSISPWNYPLQMAAWKILPAIAAGQHDRPQARRADAADQPAVRRGRPPTPVFRPAWSTCSPVAGRIADRCCYAIRRSTWCRSPAPPGSGRTVHGGGRHDR